MASHLLCTTHLLSPRGLRVPRIYDSTQGYQISHQQKAWEKLKTSMGTEVPASSTEGSRCILTAELWTAGAKHRIHLYTPKVSSHIPTLCKLLEYPDFEKQGKYC